jgi:TRAP-type C4-dicarboxylate transport system permease small subunit
VLVLIKAFLSVAEGILRSLGSPTTWTLDITLYLLLWAAFLGSSYAFQELGHIAVDFIREGVGKRFGQGLRRGLAVLGYLCTEVFLLTLVWFSFRLLRVSLLTGELTYANVQIKIAWLYSGMVVGSLLMALTVAFIILDLFSDSQRYL